MTDLKIKYCDKCHLGIFNGFVPVSGEGVKNGIMIVGETPGGTEVKRNAMFVGKAGKLLRKVLDEEGLQEHCYFTNVVKCKPPSARSPNDIELTACKPYIMREIQVVKPKLIVLLGLTAIQFIYPNERYVKNTLYRFSTFERLVIGCTYHPSYILRNRDEIDEYRYFFKRVARIYSVLNPYYTKPVKRGK